MENTPDRTQTIVVLVVVVGLSLAALAPKVRDSAWGSANTKSRVATIECLVDHGTFAIDASDYRRTIDRVRVDGKLYSSKPPMLSVLGAGAYALIKGVTGWTLQVRKKSPAVVSLNVVMMFPAHIAMLLFGFLLARRLGVRRRNALLAVVALGFGWFGAGYAVDFNNHTPAAALTLGTLALALWTSQEEKPSTKLLVAAGLIAGLLPTIDLPSGAWSAAALVVIARVHRGRALAIFAAAAAVPLLFHFWLTWLYSGSIVPVYLRPELYEKRVKGPGDGVLIYFFNITFGHHGLITMAPVTALGLIGLGLGLRKGEAQRPFVAAVAVAAAVLLLFYLNVGRNYGGTCVGFRWGIPLAAVLMTFSSVLLERGAPASWRWLVLALLVFVGQFHLQNAAANPWQRSRLERWSVNQAKKWGLVDKPAAKAKPKRPSKATKRKAAQRRRPTERLKALGPPRAAGRGPASPKARASSAPTPVAPTPAAPATTSGEHAATNASAGAAPSVEKTKAPPPPASPSPRPAEADARSP